MEVVSYLRSSFRNCHVNHNTTTSNGNYNTSTDSNNNSNDSLHKKTGGNFCNICGKRLLKLAKWRNYFTLPCKSRHMFCKQCITGRLECRQKVMRSASFDLMWTFPCPGSAQCGQELTVDWSRGRSYSKNLVARDLGSSDDSREEDDEEEEEEMEEEIGCRHHDVSAVQEIG